MKIWCVPAAAVLLALPAAGMSARPQDKPAAAGERPDLFRKLVDCRAIADNAARLACFDERVAAIDTAEQKRDVVIVDRAQVVEARKSLFGLSLPSLKIFGHGDSKEDKRADKAREDADDIVELDSTIKAASYAGDHWVFTLADGAHWVQIDGNYLSEPRPGDPIHIRKGALGSYLANVNKQVAIRVRRVN